MGDREVAPGYTGSVEEPNEIAVVVSPRVRDLPRAVVLAFALMVLAFTAVLAGMGFLIDQNRHRANDGQQSHDALCVLKDDLRQRIKDTQTFLDEHPKGFAGIPKATIQNSIRNQQLTVDSLVLLRCPSDNKV